MNKHIKNLMKWINNSVLSTFGVAILKQIGVLPMTTKNCNIVCKTSVSILPIVFFYLLPEECRQIFLYIMQYLILPVSIIPIFVYQIVNILDTRKKLKWLNHVDIQKAQMKWLYLFDMFCWIYQLFICLKYKTIFEDFWTNIYFVFLHIARIETGNTKNQKKKTKPIVKTIKLHMFL